MEIPQIAEKLIAILLEHGIKPKDIRQDGESISFDRRKITYSIYIEGEEDIHYGVESIEDADYSQDFFSNKDEYGDINHLEDFLSQIDEGLYDDYRKLWIDLEKLEEKYSDSAFIDVEEVIKEKYGLF